MTETVEYHGAWSPAHPVVLNPDGRGLPLYIRFDDAIDRALDAYFPEIFRGETTREAMRDWIKARLLDGQSVEGMRVIRREPDAART